MSTPISRRQLFAHAGVATAAIAAMPHAAAAEDKPAATDEPFGYCFNTSTIRGQKLGLVEELGIASKAGYRGVEPWIREIDAYTKGGGSLKDLRKRIVDLGLTVESAIGFAQWIVDDDAQRAAGLEQAKRDMDVVRQIGGKRIAAPPAGATNASIDLAAAARRYRALLKLGDKLGVVPQAEVWGFSRTLSRLGETAYVAVESGHPRACILPDVYHIFKGGSDFHGLKLLSGKSIHVFHVNDYPAQPERAAMNDSHRVYPGDGVAPLKQILRDLHASGFRGMLSLELFNRDYWKQDALSVARTGLRKAREVVRESMRGA